LPPTRPRKRPASGGTTIGSLETTAAVPPPGVLSSFVAAFSTIDLVLTPARPSNSGRGIPVPRATELGMPEVIFSLVAAGLGIFSNEGAIVRLISAALPEVNDEC
jgi:hypothetical protein